MGSRCGTLFRVTTFGESHGIAIGAVVEGCPPGLALDLVALQKDLDRRRPGQSELTTPRRESDQVRVVSGLHNGLTTGTPLTLILENNDHDSSAYTPLEKLYRPGHADFTYEARYGIRDHRGGGRASARETAARVAAGAVARQWLQTYYGVEVLAWVDALEDLQAEVNHDTVSASAVEASEVRCPDPKCAERMIERIEAVKADGDTVGGLIGFVARGVPSGLGDPVFDKLEADLGKACLSLPACKGFEFGSGFTGSSMRGSEHNDPMEMGVDGPRFMSNHAGGILGGISNGMPIFGRCAFKPVSSHRKPQTTLDTDGKSAHFMHGGRHDPCVLPRAVPLVEAAILLTLADHVLRFEAVLRPN